MKKFLIYNPVTKIATIETEEDIDNEEFLEGSTNEERGIQVRELSPAEEQQLEKGPTALQQFGRGLLSLGENDVKGIAGSAGRMLRDIVGETVTKGLIRRKAPVGQLGDLGVEIGGAGVMGAVDALDDERDRAIVEGDDIDYDEALKGGLGGLVGGTIGSGVGAIGGRLLKGAGDSLVSAGINKRAKDLAAGKKALRSDLPALTDEAARLGRARTDKKGSVSWEGLQRDIGDASDQIADLQNKGILGADVEDSLVQLKNSLEIADGDHGLEQWDVDEAFGYLENAEELVRRAGGSSAKDALSYLQNINNRLKNLKTKKDALLKSEVDYKKTISDSEAAEDAVTRRTREISNADEVLDLNEQAAVANSRQIADDIVSVPSSVGSAGGMRLMSEIMTEPSIKGKPLKEVTPSDMWTAIKGVPARFNRVDDRIKAEDRNARIKAMALAELDPMFAGRRAMVEDTEENKLTGYNDSWVPAKETPKFDPARAAREGEAAMIEDTKTRRRAAAHADDLKDIPSAYEYDAGQSLPDRGEPIGTEYELGMGPDVSDDDLELMRLLGYIEDEE